MTLDELKNIARECGVDVDSYYCIDDGALENFADRIFLLGQLHERRLLNDKATAAAAFLRALGCEE
jgi:hypothetical protein